MKRSICTLAALVATTAFSAPAFASSMPKADFGRANTLGLGVGNGISLSLDFPLGGSLSLGGALSLQSFSANTIDLRLLYKLLPGGRERLYLDLLGGLQIYGPRFGSFTAYYPFLGIALAYPFTNRLTGRLNVAAAIPTSGAFLFSDTRASGLELAYEFTSNLEGTIGANGRGDFLGLKFSF
jgi:hypothetical protein